MLDTSVTFYKEFRYCVYTGEYAQNLDDYVLEHPLLIHSYNLLDNYVNLLSTIESFPNLYRQSVNVKRAILMMLISIAEPFKAELGSEVHISLFLRKSIEIIRNIENKDYFKSIDFFDFIKIKHIVLILGEINSGVYIR
jgi:hypothetical protein